MRICGEKILFGILVIMIAACWGCSDDEKWYVVVPGPIGELYEWCFERGDECRDYEYDLMLYLSAVNLPNPDYSYPFLQLQGTSATGGLWDSVGFPYYEYEDIPEGVIFPERGAKGWKVKIPEARIKFCTGCDTNNGNLEMISLYGPRDLVEFVWDPEDTLEIYINRKLLKEAIN